MKRILAALTALTACLLIAACGGKTPTTHCKRGDTSMACVLKGIPAPVPKFTLTPSQQGVDFAWTKVAPSQAGAFGASYLSTDPSKDWTSALVKQYHAAGKGTVAVFETTGTSALSGCSAGASDARFSEGLLNSLGYQHAHFDMAVDFDATQAQITGPIRAYFQCANQAEPGLVGAYGDYYVIRGLCPLGIIHKSWQTYAWSGGLWQPSSCAPLEQYLNGNTFDYDRAITADYGQFPSPAPIPKPAPAPPPKPSKTVCFGKGARPRSAACKPVIALYKHRMSAALASGNAATSTEQQITVLQAREQVFRHRQQWFTTHAAALKKAWS